MEGMNEPPRFRIICVVGARPNFMKMAPLMATFERHQGVLEPCLVHTGQHYDALMNDGHFAALDLPRPAVSLDVGSAGHAVQTAEIMRRFEPVLDDFRPDAVLVVGDVNSTLACALVAAKRRVPVVHVEAGLRSFDRGMPEEINRVLTDQISDLLFTTEKGAEANLVREGIPAERVRFVGNVMIDSLRRNLDRAVPVSETLEAAGLSDAPFPNGYGVLTLHRPSNVDSPEVLSSLLTALGDVAEELPLVFPVHPRTRARIEAFGLGSLLSGKPFIDLPPVDYLQMLGLMRGATMVLTDSGGMQEETTALGIPCLTLRDSTERPITVEEGTNTMVGSDPERIRTVSREILETGGKAGRIPALWDGRAAERIADNLIEWLTKTARKVA